MNLRIALIVAASFILPANAHAMGSFPGQIKDHLGLPVAPQCQLCHGSTAGGGPIVQPFGKSMLGAGLTISGGSTLTQALDQLKSDGTDSDGDGVSDIDELLAGTNPNPDKTPIEYGCGGQIAPHSLWGDSPAFLGVLSILFVFTRRTLKGRHRDCTRTTVTKECP
jgi:hypothetical protein